MLIVFGISYFVRAIFIWSYVMFYIRGLESSRDIHVYFGVQRSEYLQEQP